MPTITYVQPDGTSRALEVPVGVSLMKAAITAGVPGIVAECGGSCMCGTCHVYVREQDAGRLPGVSDDEDEMLDCAAAERRSTSRLSCQLVCAPGLDGLVLHVPDEQV